MLRVLHKSDQVLCSESAFFGPVTHTTIMDDGDFCNTLWGDCLASLGSTRCFAILHRACRDSEALCFILLSHCVGHGNLYKSGSDSGVMEGNVSISQWGSRTRDSGIYCLGGQGLPSLAPQFQHHRWFCCCMCFSTRLL